MFNKQKTTILAISLCVSHCIALHNRRSYHFHPLPGSRLYFCHINKDEIATKTEIITNDRSGFYFQMSLPFICSRGV